ncbi:MAG: EscU/YscU/HrcU family type III secretion system export apparatus switch protein [Aquificaceae bacterium]|nr:EscU/YscU/HrcU family type III secretion system export apparatus switch protein [Aquificaceae bacterium]MCS7278157.1 EscU/YscU/HrcU family type III secretion system export apparatus switch protein [Aquificaceae bacterium]MDW8067016.1 EscU/YscU/HrcU family type III secretion system export apparatus switch protein [Aquificaceae bacterium]MDW8423752.1 EscU/YscU/HrcU family type III secretion system export apparatus switch protein [Aquificaceae bacterium]
MERKKAVAIKYDQGEKEVPVVVAKGVGDLAERIIETAKKYGVPVIEDRGLLSALMKVEVYEEIPPELYRAVAKVLVFVGAIRKSS